MLFLGPRANAELATMFFLSITYLLSSPVHRKFTVLPQCSTSKANTKIYSQYRQDTTKILPHVPKLTTVHFAFENSDCLDQNEDFAVSGYFQSRKFKNEIFAVLGF